MMWIGSDTGKKYMSLSRFLLLLNAKWPEERRLIVTILRRVFVVAFLFVFFLIYVYYGVESESRRGV